MDLCGRCAPFGPGSDLLSDHHCCCIRHWPRFERHHLFFSNLAVTHHSSYTALPITYPCSAAREHTSHSMASGAPTWAQLRQQARQLESQVCSLAMRAGKDVSDIQPRQRFCSRYTHNTPPHPTYHPNPQKQNSPQSRRSMTSLSKCVDSNARYLRRPGHLIHTSARIHNNFPHTPARIRNATISPQIFTSLPSP